MEPMNDIHVSGTGGSEQDPHNECVNADCTVTEPHHHGEAWCASCDGRGCPSCVKDFGGVADDPDDEMRVPECPWCATAQNTLRIATGNNYVGGVLCEHHRKAALQDTATCVICGMALAHTPRLGENIMHTFCERAVRVRVDEAARRAARSARADERADVLALLNEWSDAYPADMFPSVADGGSDEGNAGAMARHLIATLRREIAAGEHTGRKT